MSKKYVEMQISNKFIRFLHSFVLSLHGSKSKCPKRGTSCAEVNSVLSRAYIIYNNTTFTTILNINY